MLRSIVLAVIACVATGQEQDQGGNDQSSANDKIIQETLSSAVEEYNLTTLYVSQFTDYISTFNKTDEYLQRSTLEYAERYQLFIANGEYIDELNARMRRYLVDPTIYPNRTFVLLSLNFTNETVFYEHTYFSDLTEDEAKAMTGTDNEENGENDVSKDQEQGRRRRLAISGAVGVTSETRQSEYNLVTAWAPAVQNQGGCGSCWAFASTAQMEINYNIEQGFIFPSDKFSEQFTLDCSGVGSCSGGNTGAASVTFEDQGLCTTGEYGAYSPTQGTCAGCSDDNTIWADETYQLEAGEGNNFGLAAAVVSNFKALHVSFSTYRSFRFVGSTTPYYFGWECLEDIQDGLTNGRHAVAIVGQKKQDTNFTFTVELFGKEYELTDTGYDDYLYIRNSWGTGWGDGGYAWFHESAEWSSTCRMTKFIYSVPDAAFSLKNIGFCELFKCYGVYQIVFVLYTMFYLYR